MLSGGVCYSLVSRGWFELPATDLERATRFHEAVF